MVDVRFEQRRHDSQRTCMQVERTGFGSSVKLVNADTNTVLRSCGLHEAVRDTVQADTSPAARWNLEPCDGLWFSLRPASDESEVSLYCSNCEIEAQWYVLQIAAIVCWHLLSGRQCMCFLWGALPDGGACSMLTELIKCSANFVDDCRT